MDAPGLKPEVQDALATMQRYFADSAPPLEAEDSITILLTQPPRLLAGEIANWVAAQYQGKGAREPVSELILKAMKKLHAMGTLMLVAEEPLAEYLNSLGQAILAFCPAAEREVLLQKLGLLGQEESEAAGRSEFLHLSTGPAASAEEWAGSEFVQRDRRLARLLERMEKLPAGTEGGSIPAPEAVVDLVPLILVAGVRNARNGSEFRQLQDGLGSFGIQSRTDQILRSLAGSLPGWGLVFVDEGTGERAYSAPSPPLEAMQHVVCLAENSREGSRRFRELVDSAVEQFNSGSLQRAVAIFDLADQVAPQGPIDAHAVEAIRGSGLESLDPGRVREFAQNPGDRPLLGRIAAFYSDLQPASLMDKLATESRRERRHLLLVLLEVGGQAARAEALRRLDKLVAGGASLESWYFPRNLLYLLQHIPRCEDASVEKEVALTASLLDPALPATLVREAINDLGQIRHEKAEERLVSFLQRLEEMLSKPGAPESQAGKLWLLLDRVVSALSRSGTRKACVAVALHGLKRKPELGDTLERLASLAALDLSQHEEVVSSIVGALKAVLPRRILGVVVPKDTASLLNLIRALSGTPAPVVREVFREVAERFPEHECGRAASQALQQFDSAAEPARTAGVKLGGDLGLFDLPELLLQLARTNATGKLALNDREGNAVGALSLERGRLRSCRAGHLVGDDALYRLFERPVRGTFAFVAEAAESPATPPESGPRPELARLIAEGMRRHEEYRGARVLAPDGASFKAAGPAPRPDVEGEAPGFSGAVWQLACQGATPEECEAGFPVDPLRVRRLLARWVEEGALAPA